jgi:hypothetical protein
MGEAALRAVAPLELADQLTLNQEEACALLGISPRTFQHRRQALEAAGFPRRLPGLNRYSTEAIRTWIANQDNAARQSTEEGDDE